MCVRLACGKVGAGVCFDTLIQRHGRKEGWREDDREGVGEGGTSRIKRGGLECGVSREDY